MESFTIKMHDAATNMTSLLLQTINDVLIGIILYETQLYMEAAGKEFGTSERTTLLLNTLTSMVTSPWNTWLKLTLKLNGETSLQFYMSYYLNYSMINLPNPCNLFLKHRKPLRGREVLWLSISLVRA